MQQIARITATVLLFRIIRNTFLMPVPLPKHDSSVAPLGLEYVGSHFFLYTCRPAGALVLSFPP